MKITNIKIDTLKMELFKPFTVALGTITEVETLLVQIETDESISGIGEGAPFEFVTGETLKTSLSVAKMLGERLIGQDPTSVEKIHHIMDRTIIGNTAAKAAIDIAIHDIIGKKMDKPLYKVLGGYNNSLLTDMTIGIDSPENMAAEAQGKVDQGFTILKIKAGIDLTQDVEAIRLIRKRVGDRIHLRVDANQGWSATEAVQFMEKVREYRVEAVEQPVPYWDIDGLADIRKKVSTPLMADESAHSPNDALTIVRKQAADIINIKLMKSGGLYKAEKINHIAEAAGLRCMVGCMLESKISITAGASLVAAKKNITKADLDSFLYVKDPGIRGGVTLENDRMTLSEKPGLGIELEL